MRPVVLAWTAACSRGGTGDDSTSACTVDVLQPFDVRLVVLTQHEDAPSATSSHLDPETGETLTGAEVLDREVQILNAYFVAANRSPPCVDGSCVTFRAKDYAFYDDVKFRDWKDESRSADARRVPYRVTTPDRWFIAPDLWRGSAPERGRLRSNRATTPDRWVHRPRLVARRWGLAAPNRVTTPHR